MDERVEARVGDERQVSGGAVRIARSASVTLDKNGVDALALQQVGGRHAGDASADHQDLSRLDAHVLPEAILSDSVRRQE